MELKPTVTLPTPAAPPTQVVEPVAAVTTETAAAPTTTAAAGKGADDKGKDESFTQRVTRRMKEAKDAEDGKAPKVEDAGKAEEDKKGAKAEEDKKDARGKTGDDLESDASIEAEITAKTKDMTGAQKQAFADKTYQIRDLKRQLKAVTGTSAEVETLKTQLADVQKKLDAKGTSAVADPEEVTQLRAKLEAYEADLTVAKVEKTEAFKTAVTKPLEKVEQNLAVFAKKYELKAADMMAALSDTSPEQSDKLEAVMEPMNSVDKTRFMRLLDQVTDANEKAETLRANAKEALAKIEAKQQGQSQEDQTKIATARKAAHETNWKALEEDLPDVLKTFEGADPSVTTWNAALEEAQTGSRDADFASLKPEVQSALQQRAAVYPLLVGAYTSVKAQLSDLKAKYETDLADLTKFRETQADAGNKTAAKAAGDDDEKDFVKRVTKRFKEAAGVGR